MSASTPIQTSLNNLSAWASFDSLLQRLDITTDPDFWDGLVTLIPYQDYFLESQYNDLAEGCVPGEAQQGPNKTQTPNPPNQPDPECLCANSPFYAWEIHGIECTEYRLLYWYHPDYGTSRATVARSKARLATVMRDLGHNEFITDYLSRACRGMAGLPYQYFHYSAFGETLVEDNAHYGQFSSPYRFNAKELDQETGNYYYGARYYNPTWSVWLSVDPLAGAYPHLSPYNFVENNPIRLVDPTGLGPEDPDEEGWTEPVVTSFTASRTYDPITRTTTYSTTKTSLSELKKENGDGKTSWSASLLKTETSEVIIDSEGNVVSTTNTEKYSGWNAEGDLNIGEAGSSENHDYEKVPDFIKLQVWREQQSVQATGLVVTEYLSDYGNKLQRRSKIATPLLVITNIVGPLKMPFILAGVGLGLDVFGPTPESTMGPSPNATDHNYFRKKINLN